MGRESLCGAAASRKGSERGCSISTSGIWWATRSPSLCPLQELGYVDLLELEEVEAGILAANKKGEEERASESLGCWRQVLPPRHVPMELVALPGQVSQGWMGHGHLLQPGASPARLLPQCCGPSAGSTRPSAEGCRPKRWKR